MKLEEQIRNCKKEMIVTPKEKHIQETIKKSIDTFCAGEQEKRLNYWEFLWLQLGLIRKKWWLFQFAAYSNKHGSGSYIICDLNHPRIVEKQTMWVYGN